VFASDESNGLSICLSSFPEMVPAIPFIDARGTPGYMHVLRDIFPRKEDLRPPVVGGISLLEEWLLSFDAVATCPVIRSPVDDAATTRRVMTIPVATCLPAV
jgi:hypothetical protein